MRLTLFGGIAMRISVITAAVLVLLFGGSRAHAQIRKVEVIVHTTDDDKDYNTRLKIAVWRGGQCLAVADNIASNMRLPDPSFHTAVLNVTNGNFGPGAISHANNIAVKFET